MKLTKRKGFNFFRSYYDVYNELSDKDKIAFMDALLDRQFLGVKPTNLEGMAKFAYISQTNSIDSQVKGYEDKTGNELNNTPRQGGTAPPRQGGRQGGLIPPTEQEKGKGEVKEKVKEQDVYRKINHLVLTNQEFENLLEKHSKVEIDNILDEIENFKGNTKYVSLNLTIQTWLRNRKKDVPSHKRKVYS